MSFLNTKSGNKKWEDHFCLPSVISSVSNVGLKIYTLVVLYYVCTDRMMHWYVACSRPCIFSFSKNSFIFLNNWSFLSTPVIRNWLPQAAPWIPTSSGRLNHLMHWLSRGSAVTRQLFWKLHHAIQHPKCSVVVATSLEPGETLSIQLVTVANNRWCSTSISPMQPFSAPKLLFLTTLKRVSSHPAKNQRLEIPSLKHWNLGAQQIQHAKQPWRNRESSMSFSRSVNLRESYWKHSSNKCPMFDL